MTCLEAEHVAREVFAQGLYAKVFLSPYSATVGVFWPTTDRCYAVICSHGTIVGKGSPVDHRDAPYLLAQKIRRELR